MAGIAGKIVEYPFDTIKVRLQCQPLNAVKGPIDCIRQGLQEEGFRGLYKVDLFVYFGLINFKVQRLRTDHLTTLGTLSSTYWLHV